MLRYPFFRILIKKQHFSVYFFFKRFLSQDFRLVFFKAGGGAIQ